MSDYVDSGWSVPGYAWNDYDEYYPDASIAAHSSASPIEIPQCSRQEVVQMAKNRNRWRAATSRGVAPILGVVLSTVSPFCKSHTIHSIPSRFSFTFCSFIFAA